MRPSPPREGRRWRHAGDTVAPRATDLHKPVVGRGAQRGEVDGRGVELGGELIPRPPRVARRVRALLQPAARQPASQVARPAQTASQAIRQHRPPVRQAAQARPDSQSGQAAQAARQPGRHSRQERDIGHPMANRQGRSATLDIRWRTVTTTGTAVRNVLSLRDAIIRAPRGTRETMIETMIRAHTPAHARARDRVTRMTPAGRGARRCAAAAGSAAPRGGSEGTGPDITLTISDRLRSTQQAAARRRRTPPHVEM